MSARLLFAMLLVALVAVASRAWALDADVVKKLGSEDAAAKRKAQRRVHADTMRSLGMVRTRNGGWE